MAGVNTSNVGLTFTNYLQGVVETLQQKSKLRTLLQKSNKKWTGDFLEGRVHVSRSPAVGNTEEGGAFPVAGHQGYVPFRAYRKITHGAIQLTDVVMATAKDDKNSARGAVSSEVKGMMSNIMKYENGMLFRDGTGSVAQILTNPGGTDKYAIVNDARMLWEGQTFQVYDDASGAPTGASRGDLRVLSITPDPTSGGFQVNFDPAGPNSGTAGATGGVGATADDHLVWNNSLNRAFTGLSKLVDDSPVTFQHVNVSTYPRYSSLVMDNSGNPRALTPSLFRGMLAGIHAKSGSETPINGLEVICNAWQAINVEELYEGELRLTPENKVGGLSVAAFQSALGRINIRVDIDALHGQMFFLDLSKIRRAVQKELAWRKNGNSIFTPSQVAGVYTANAIEISECYIEERNTSGRLVDLQQSPTTAH